MSIPVFRLQFMYYSLCGSTVTLSCSSPFTRPLFQIPWFDSALDFLTYSVIDRQITFATIGNEVAYDLTSVLLNRYSSLVVLVVFITQIVMKLTCRIVRRSLS